MRRIVKIALIVGILACAFLVWRFIYNPLFIPELPPPVLIVTISPDYQSGLPGENLLYIVTVKNVGKVRDTYILMASDNSGWVLAFSDNLLEIPPGENRQTTFRATIPENAIPMTKNKITVTASGREEQGGVYCFAYVSALQGP